MVCGLPGLTGRNAPQLVEVDCLFEIAVVWGLFMTANHAMVLTLI